MRYGEVMCEEGGGEGSGSAMAEWSCGHGMGKNGCLLCFGLDEVEGISAIGTLCRS